MSSIVNAPGNAVYADLIMTRYPNTFDERSGAKDNLNMHRWTNLTDYNMAEHVNALQDAVMAIQRSLGELPQLNSVVKDSSGNVVSNATTISNIASGTNVKLRLDKLEDFSWVPYDRRFGGPTWEANTGSSIQEHKHNGVDSNPGKISLTAEVTGKLPVANIDLTSGATGLTGDNILLSKTSTSKISDALNDKLSLSTGGVVGKDATIDSKGKTQTRWNLELDYRDRPVGVGTQTDANASLGTSVKVTGNTFTTALIREMGSLYFGKYILIARLASDSLVNENMVEVVLETTGGTVIKRTTYKGTDFAVAGQYKQFYMPIDYDGANGIKRIKVNKLNTTANVALNVDYVLVTPIHPAVFDR